MKSIYVTIVRWIGIFLNAAILLFTIFSIFDFVGISKSLSALIIIGLQVIAIIINKLFEFLVDKMIFHKCRKKVLRSLSDEETRIQMSRNQLRNGLNIVMTVAVILLFILCLYSKSPLLFVAYICIISIAYMYADYLPSVKAYAEYYDSLTLGDRESPRTIRGLAKIYNEEYKKTKFDYKNAYYKDIMLFEEDKKNQYQDDCIKSILRIKIDAIRCPDIVYSLLIMFFNIFLVIPNLAEQTLSLVMNNVDVSYISTLLLIANITFLCINIATLFKYQNDCDRIQNIVKAYFSGNSKDRFYEYSKILNEDYDYKTIHSRGVFVYCSTLIDKGKFLEDIPLNYKMLYIHRYEANKSRFVITISLSILALSALLLGSGFNLVSVLVISLILIILSLLYYFFGLKYLNKYRIIKEIKKL